MNFSDFVEHVERIGDNELGDVERWVACLKWIKKKNHFTYDEISSLVHVPVRSLQNWVGGVREPPPYVMPLICYALHDFY